MSKINNGWEPAETAPKDGLPFLAYADHLVHADTCPNGVVSAIWNDGYFDAAIFSPREGAWMTEEISKFSHWQRILPP